MKILIVSQNFYPDNFTINGFSFELVRLGHDITVLTGLPDYATGYIPPDYVWPKIKFENVNGVKVHRCRISPRKKGVVNRLFNYASFLFSSNKKIRTLDKDFDIIFVFQTSPISMADAAVRFGKAKCIPVLLYCLDLWPESLKAWNMSEKNILYKILDSYSKSVYHKASHIAISSSFFRKYLTDKHHISSKKISYLPQYYLENVSNDVLDNPFKDGKKHFVFAGNIGAAQLVDQIVYSSRKLLDFKELDNEWIIDIFGDGSEFSNVVKLSEELKLTNKVIFHGRVSQEELNKYYKYSYAFLLTLSDQNAIGYTLPAKLQGYLSAGKPVIAMASGSVKELIEQTETGLVSKPYDIAAFAKSIAYLLKQPSQAEKMGYNGRQYFIENFTLDVFVNKFDEIVEKMIEEFDVLSHQNK